MATLTRKPVQVYLRPEQVEQLRAMARRRKLPVAELVRQGVDKVLRDTRPEEDPLWELVGVADAEFTDLAEKHDEYLARSHFEAHRR